MRYTNLQNLRGSSFEELINFTNEVYKKNNLALIQKIATPIKPIELNNKEHKISLAYFEKKSSVDYIGVVQGVPVCFDAKETALKSLPLKNIHEHQFEFMHSFQNQKGIAFLLVHFSFNDTYFYLPFNILDKFWKASKQPKGKKSIPYEELKFKITCDNVLHYLDCISRDIN
jgi:recombination protein U